MALKNVHILRQNVASLNCRPMQNMRIKTPSTTWSKFLYLTRDVTKLAVESLKKQRVETVSWDGVRRRGGFTSASAREGNEQGMESEAALAAADVAGGIGRTTNPAPFCSPV